MKANSAVLGYLSCRLKLCESLMSQVMLRNKYYAKWETLLN